MTARYVAFNPSSSETSEFVEGNSLREVIYELAARGFLQDETFQESRLHLRRIARGYWQIDSYEIYELRLHPSLREQVNSWRTVTA